MAWAVTLPNYSETWRRLRTRIVRGDVYERIWTMGGAVCGVLHVRDNLAAREHLPLRLSVAHSAIDHPPLSHLLLLLLVRDNRRAEIGRSWEPIPQAKTHVYYGLVSIFLSKYFFFWHRWCALAPSFISTCF
jgi:hypothetical protein